jgi:hypothetical protein
MLPTRWITKWYAFPRKSNVSADTACMEENADCVLRKLFFLSEQKFFVYLTNHYKKNKIRPLISEKLKENRHQFAHLSAIMEHDQHRGMATNMKLSR